MSIASPPSTGARATKIWQLLSPYPGGKFLFSKILGLIIPYTGSMRASVQHFEPGHAIVHLKDRRRVRNHLNSVHAIALANLGELTTGLAALSGMPDNARGILTGLTLEYHKKARGLLRSHCQCDITMPESDEDLMIKAEIFDVQGDCVATANACWRIGPTPPKA